MPRSFLQKNNDKIQGAFIFNLPTRVTCPGSTKCCRDICYARCQERFYHHVVPQYRASMYEVAQSSKFKDVIIAALTLELQGSKIRALRIHESGDFFSQDYLDAWVAIIRAFPSISFWAYTKSYMLDFKEALKLKNLNLRYSVDPTTEHLPKQKIARAVVATDKPRGSITCPSALSKGHTIKCVRDCRLCLDTNKTIHFPPHGFFKSHLAQYESNEVN